MRSKSKNTDFPERMLVSASGRKMEVEHTDAGLSGDDEYLAIVMADGRRDGFSFDFGVLRPHQNLLTANSPRRW